MTYQSHLVWSAAAGLMCWPYAMPRSAMELPAFALWMGAAVFGGVIPDIDHPKSWLGSRIPVIPTLLYTTTGHRGATHSFLALGASALVVYGIAGLLLNGLASQMVAQAYLVGFVAHLIGDYLSNHGVPLLWPWSTKLGWSVCSTGSSTERGLTLGVLGAAFALCALQYGLQWPR